MSTVTVSGRHAYADSVLVDAAVSGDSSAFHTLVRRHRSSLFGHALTSLRDPHAAADAVQETFISAWRNLADYRGDSTVSTWLHSICSHKIADIQRARQSRRLVVVDTAALECISGADDPAVSVQAGSFVTELRRALADLPVRQRRVWILREIHTVTYPAIGRLLGMTASAVRGQHARATAALARRLEAWRP